ncbi:regulatory protein RecX [Nocardioides marmotae]|uniref:regulatory protein RecX n=1 Tax=Nocardioides marmotae TaxID=2663857 RepID=UPI0012B5193F|nr:regulatory protein RecX [Nocardioides marmotae]MBC9733517.1 regulatory protein RecX [Nocardioides marmotae]MTB84624.1 regulatory protein RecX [Nocardioides marmotae]
MPDFRDDRPPPSWLGDVADGVDAWTQRAATPATPAVEDDAPRPSRTGVGRGAGSRSGGRSGGRPGGRSGSRRGRSTPPPEDPVAAGPPADPEAVARKILLDQLTGQARSRKQLADKLEAKDVPAELAERLLDRFEEVGLVDDEAFARAWIASRQPGKGLARRALAQELRRKGVADEVAREALDEIDPADEEEAARALVRKKLRSLSRVDDATATRRLVGMLARKGYGGGLAFAVVREELAQAGRDDDVLPEDPDLD